jgi:hypothetical protein
LKAAGATDAVIAALLAAVIVAGKRVRKLQFGRRNDDPVLAARV